MIPLWQCVSFRILKTQRRFDHDDLLREIIERGGEELAVLFSSKEVV